MEEETIEDLVNDMENGEEKMKGRVKNLINFFTILISFFIFLIFVFLTLGVLICIKYFWYLLV